MQHRGVGIENTLEFFFFLEAIHTQGRLFQEASLFSRAGLINLNSGMGVRESCCCSPEALWLSCVAQQQNEIQQSSCTRLEARFMKALQRKRHEES